MAEGHTIETYGRAPHNRNIWPYNSQAAAPPSRLADSFVCAGSGTLITTVVFEGVNEIQGFKFFRQIIPKYGPYTMNRKFFSIYSGIVASIVVGKSSIMTMNLNLPI